VTVDRKTFTLLTALAVCHAGPAAAQFAEPDISKARLRVGPVLFNPVVEITNFGIDTNVFNEPADQAKRDFTFTVSPRTDLWMKFGRTWITGIAREDVLWFNQYTSERAANHTATLGWLVPLNRLVFQASGTYVNARERPGFEIDTRSQRMELELKGAAEIRALSKTFIGIRGGRQRVDFDKDAVFRGESLRQQLNRTVTTGAVTLRNQLTPLTSVTFDVGRVQDRFAFSPLRDADSTIAGVQVTFDPSALIKGSARFGYRDFRPTVAGLPEFQGATLAIDLSYTFLETTRVGFRSIRDVSYSYEVNQPYYLESGMTGTITQQIFGPLDVVFRGGWQTLAYRDRPGALVPVSNRTDTVRTIGGGAGYHFASDLRIGINVERQRRVSDVSLREYDALRIGASVSYGF
jgi:hypothetical protein